MEITAIFEPNQEKQLAALRYVLENMGSGSQTIQRSEKPKKQTEKKAA